MSRLDYFAIRSVFAKLAESKQLIDTQEYIAADLLRIKLMKNL